MNFWLALTLAFMAGTCFGYGIMAILLMAGDRRDEYP
jgi:hypothetical protein